MPSNSRPNLKIGVAYKLYHIGIVIFILCANYATIQWWESIQKLFLRLKKREMAHTKWFLYYKSEIDPVILLKSWQFEIYTCKQTISHSKHLFELSVQAMLSNLSKLCKLPIDVGRDEMSIIMFNLWRIICQLSYERSRNLWLWLC